MITTVWIIGISFVPQYTVFIMLASFYLCYKSEYFKEKYYYKMSIMFMILGIYYVIWLIAKVFSIFSSVFYLIAVVPVLVSAIPLLAIMVELICTLISGMKIVLNSNLPGMDSVCCFFGKYNLGRQKAESDDKICRLESEINIRKKRIEEEEFKEFLKM